MSNFRVDVIIAVHTLQRPIRRAVASVLEHTQASVRVTVVAHGIEAEAVATLLEDYSDREDLRVVSFTDGIPSPAGPMNHGLTLATAPFTSLLGSDDEFAPGAIDFWLDEAQHWNAAAVVARIDFAEGGVVPQPPIRPFRSGLQDPVKDRLAYRSAPLGIISTNNFGHLRLQEGLETGEDILYSLKIWFSGCRIVFADKNAGYLLHQDGSDRVTVQHRPLTEELEAVYCVVHDAWFARLDQVQQEAILIKLLRVHVLGALGSRAKQYTVLQTAELDELNAVVDKMLIFVPRLFSLLSLTELDLLTIARQPQPDLAELAASSQSWLNKKQLKTLMPTKLRMLFHAQAPARYGVASVLVGKLMPK